MKAASEAESVIRAILFPRGRISIFDEPLKICAPKGLKNLAQGFNPGNHQASRFALKGREIDSRLILLLTPSI
jgi:hypothetical protein